VKARAAVLSLSACLLLSACGKGGSAKPPAPVVVNRQTTTAPQGTATTSAQASSTASNPQKHVEVVIATNTVKGRHATATASADAGRKTTFSTHVTATPSQRVTGGWVISCNEHGLVSRDAADFSGRTPLAVRMHPDQAAGSHLLGGAASCEVVATASLARSGRVTVAVLGGR
jgi:hypothetical protein